MYKSLTLFFIVLFIFLLSCNKNSNTEPTVPALTSPNILLIIADDLGKDALSGYSQGTIKPNTPNLDALRTNGLLFSNFWANPTCSPTRASIITGKYGYRTGVKKAGDVLSTSEISLQKYINNNTGNKYSTAIIGKWHLSGNTTSVNPESFGIDYYSGIMFGAVGNYYQWQLTENGINTPQTQYTTQVFTDLAVNWLNQQNKPWFLWLAYNAPHTPFHIPPGNMHSQGNLPNYTNGMNATPYYMASIEAMDYQIGRLLNSMSSEERANTVVIFMGDNGTPDEVAQSPYSSDKVKNTLYQGGINVPLIISGKGVSRTGIDNNLITSTDLFATVSQIAGLNITQYQDSRSFKALFTSSSIIRTFQYSDMNNGTNDLWTINNGQYKLIKNLAGNDEMYNLSQDANENINLLNNPLSVQALNAKTQLEAELLNIRN